MDDIDGLINRLEKDGEEKIRKRLLADAYDPTTKCTVVEWLSSKENERNRKRMDKHLAISISVKHAAWVAAIAALISTLIAITAWIW